MKPGIAKTSVREPEIASSISSEPSTTLRNQVEDALDLGFPESPSHPPSNPDADAQQQEIRIRAYELYVEGGSQDGHAEEDWLNAEREIRGHSKATESTPKASRSAA